MAKRSHSTISKIRSPLHHQLTKLPAVSLLTHRFLHSQPRQFLIYPLFKRLIDGCDQFLARPLLQSRRHSYPTLEACDNALPHVRNLIIHDVNQSTNQAPSEKCLTMTKNVEHVPPREHLELREPQRHPKLLQALGLRISILSISRPRIHIS